MEATCLYSPPAEDRSTSKTAERSPSIKILSPRTDSPVAPPPNSAPANDSHGVPAPAPTAAQLVPAAAPDPTPSYSSCNACLGGCAVLLFVLSALFAGMMTFHTFRRVEYVSRLLQDVVNETRRLDMRAAHDTLDGNSTTLFVPREELGGTSASSDYEGVAIDNGTGVYLGRFRN